MGCAITFAMNCFVFLWCTCSAIYFVPFEHFLYKMVVPQKELSSRHGHRRSRAYAYGAGQPLRDQPQPAPAGPQLPVPQIRSFFASIYLSQLISWLISAKISHLGHSFLGNSIQNCSHATILDKTRFTSLWSSKLCLLLIPFLNPTAFLFTNGAKMYCGFKSTSDMRRIWWSSFFTGKAKLYLGNSDLDKHGWA